MMRHFRDEHTRDEFIEKAKSTLGSSAERDTIAKFAADNGYALPYFIFDNSRRVSRGTYSLESNPTTTHPVKKESAPDTTVQNVVRIDVRKVATNVTDSFVPEKDPTYEPFGFYSDLKKVIKSGLFYPVYITGLSGNGKTLMVDQVCADLKRELVRVNITKETDETDLIGSYELVDGNTVRREGPVITAMRRGAILLLDETDYGSERLLCLQPILEGKGYFDKKTGEFIHPKTGFNVIATANTKGKGSDDGRFIGANVLNEAFLERFAITVEQEYPAEKVELAILKNNFDRLGIKDEESAIKLVKWAAVIRKSFDEGAVDEIISTRRLVHIVRAYDIFSNLKRAIELCLNRFDKDTKDAFYDLYEKMQAPAQEEPKEPKEQVFF